MSDFRFGDVLRYDPDFLAKDLQMVDDWSDFRVFVIDGRPTQGFGAQSIMVTVIAPNRGGRTIWGSIGTTHPLNPHHLICDG